LKNHTLTKTHNTITLAFNSDSFPKEKYDNLTLICADGLQENNCTYGKTQSTWNCSCKNLKELTKYSLKVATNSGILNRSKSVELPDETITSSLKNKIR
jgi:hypothetical protein